ncbi:MAG: hypothetical protein IJL90_02255, partial [Lachnospiraceae bacterium]|nr:hypothetical protein [Lachnospiraceae bacterium]
VVIGDLFAAPGMESTGVMAYFTYPGGTFEEAEESVAKLLQNDIDRFWLGHGDPCTKEELTSALETEINQKKA